MKMKKLFKLEGLDCANCGAKIERAVAKLDGIQTVTVNFMTTKMSIEAEESKMDSILEEAKAIIKKIDAQVVMKKA